MVVSVGRKFLCNATVLVCSLLLLLSASGDTVHSQWETDEQYYQCLW